MILGARWELGKEMEIYEVLTIQKYNGTCIRESLSRLLKTVSLRQVFSYGGGTYTGFTVNSLTNLLLMF